MHSTYTYTGIRFIVLYFIAPHRYCVFYKSKAKPSTNKKDYDSLCFGDLERNPQYLYNVPIREGHCSPFLLTVAMIAPVPWKPCGVLNPQILRSQDLRSGHLTQSVIFKLFSIILGFSLFSSAFSKDFSVPQLESLLGFPQAWVIPYSVHCVHSL